MYHMVSIPLADQHVHRFVWRNCETDKEPGIHVRTVLTFEDRPLQCKRQRALREITSPERQKQLLRTLMSIIYAIQFVQSTKPKSSPLTSAKSSNQAVFTSKSEYQDEMPNEKVIVGRADDAEMLREKLSLKIKTECFPDTVTNQSHILFHLS